MAVKHVLKPKKIAFVGASEKPGWGTTISDNLFKQKDLDNFYFVNPKRETVWGRKCYKSLSDLPEVPDSVLVSIPSVGVNAIMEEAGQLGIKGAVILTSGFSEERSEEGPQRAKELKEICDKYGITVCGPNCAGALNFVDEIFQFGIVLYETERKGGIAIISQSGQYVALPVDQAYGKFSYCVSCGNCDVTSILEYLEFMVDDEDTKVICMYLEGISGDPHELIRILEKAQAKKKPIVVLKNGKTPKSAGIAKFHTGSYAGDYSVYEKIFKKYGVISVDDVSEMFNTALALDIMPTLPKGNNYVLVASSGGEISIATDLGAKYGLNYPEYSPETAAKLAELIPGFATVHNPLDATAEIFFDDSNFVDIVKVFNEDENIDGMITVATFIEKEEPNGEFRNVLPFMTQIKEETENLKPMFVVPYMECGRDIRVRNGFAEIGVPLLPTGGVGLKIIGYITDFITNKYGDIEITEEELQRIVE